MPFSREGKRPEVPGEPAPAAEDDNDTSEEA